MSGAIHLTTRFLDFIKTKQNGACIHMIQEKFADNQRVHKAGEYLDKLYKKGLVTIIEDVCTRVVDEHDFYIAADPEPPKKSKKATFDGTLVVTPKEGNTHTQNADLRSKSVDELSEEIYARCKEIQDRLRGGSWVFSQQK